TSPPRHNRVIWGRDLAARPHRGLSGREVRSRCEITQSCCGSEVALLARPLVRAVMSWLLVRAVMPWLSVRAVMPWLSVRAVTQHRVESGAASECAYVHACPMTNPPAATPSVISFRDR